jgi:predicted dehydrogenase
MAMTRIKTAVVGAGHLGKIHARLMASQPLSWFDSIVEPFEAARLAASDEFAVDVYADHRDLIGKVDAVIVAAPTTLHYAICRDYLSAGMHVLVEKPITQTIEQAEELVSLARKHDCVLQVGHVERFNPAWRTGAAAIGEVRFMEARRTSPYTFRSTDVGVVLDLMIHDLDLLLSLTNSEPVDVCATGQAVLGPHEDIAYATIRFADGMAASLHASRCSDQPQRTAHLFGEHGAATIDMTQRTISVLRPTEAQQEGVYALEKLAADDRLRLKDKFFQEVMTRATITVAGTNAIRDEQADFLSAISHRHAPQVTGEDGLRALSLAQEITAQIGAQRTAPTIFTFNAGQRRAA